MLRLRAALNRWRRRLVRGLQFRVLFGERSQGRDLPHTRISPSTCIECEDRLVLADHVYIGHFNLLDASGGLTIDEGVQITSHCAIVTHSSHRSQRLLGRAFATWSGPGERPGWIGGPVHIGAYSFIGPHSVIEANTRLGRGTVVCAGARVRGVFPDFAVLDGHPAQVVGDSRDGDATLFQQYPASRVNHDAWAATPESDERASASDHRRP
jgi:acetyltransferase-like isoleucine patch superfamily enzyme